MTDRTALRSVILWSIAVALTTTIVGCSESLKGMDSCKNAKDVKLIIKLDNGNPKSVNHDKIGTPDAEFAVVCPNKNVTWRLPGPKGFTIKFKTTSPFGWTNMPSAGGKVVGAVPAVADYGGYEYTVEVDGSTEPLDPIIIVDR